MSDLADTALGKKGSYHPSDAAAGESGNTASPPSMVDTALKGEGEASAHGEADRTMRGDASTE